MLYEPPVLAIETGLADRDETPAAAAVLAQAAAITPMHLLTLFANPALDEITRIFRPDRLLAIAALNSCRRRIHRSCNGHLIRFHS
jgi:hypothetical protein